MHFQIKKLEFNLSIIIRNFRIFQDTINNTRMPMGNIFSTLCKNSLLVVLHTYIILISEF